MITAAQLIWTLTVAVYNVNTGTEYTWTQNMSEHACKFERRRLALESAAGETTIVTCVPTRVER